MEQKKGSALTRLHKWALDEERILNDGGYAAGDASGGPDPDDVLEVVRLLYEVYSAHSSIQRLAYELDDAWPKEGSEAFEAVADACYPDDGYCAPFDEEPD